MHTIIVYILRNNSLRMHNQFMKCIAESGMERLKRMTMKSFISPLLIDDLVFLNIKAPLFHCYGFLVTNLIIRNRFAAVSQIVIQMS